MSQYRIIIGFVLLIKLNTNITAANLPTLTFTSQACGPTYHYDMGLLSRSLVHIFVPVHFELSIELNTNITAANSHALIFNGHVDMELFDQRSLGHIFVPVQNRF